MLKSGGLEELQAHPERFGDLREEMRELCKTNLYFLCKGVMGYDKLVPRLHWPMCQFVQAPPSRFDLMMAFRGSFKSTIGTVGRTVQNLLRGPNHVLIFSEAAMMAESWSREARTPFEGGNPLMSWLFPELMGGQKSSAKWGDAEWHLPGGRKVHAAGLDTSTMGIHVNTLIMDDVFSDPRGDKTTDYADRILQFIKMSLPLVKDPSKDERHLIGVRWWLDGEPYAYYRKNLPASDQFFLPLLDAEHDECVWPERFPPDEVDQLRADPFVFASQYLLDPVSQDTAIFKRGTLHFFDEKPTERNYTKVLAYDPAYSKERRSDSNALVVASVDAKGGVWIEYAEKRKLDAHEAKRWAVQQALKYKPDFFAIEANGPQMLFFDDVKRELQRYPLSHDARKVVLVPLKPHKDKVARWNQLASGCATGQVRIQRNLTGLVSEMYRVTGSKHESNDTVDAAAHLVGPELRNKKPMRLTDVSDQAWLPHALQDENLHPKPADWMRM